MSIPAAGSSAGPRTNPVADVLARVMGYFSNRDDMAPQNEIVTYITTAYLDQIDPGNPPAPRVLEKELLAIMGSVIKAVNSKAAMAAERYPLPRYLTYWQIAQILLRLHHVIRIAPNAGGTEREYDLLAMYQPTGHARGTYTPSEDDIRATARMYNTQMSLKEFAEVLAVLREDSPRRHKSTHRDFIAARNGIVFYGAEPLDVTIFGKDFHFEPKQVHPFDPAIVLLTKNDVDYVDDAPQQVITHPEDGDWEVAAWIKDLFDQPGDEGFADLIWEIIGAIIRPHVVWRKTAWFFSTEGNNGKGTLCALMRNLVGSGAHASIPLADFGKDFALEPLVRANAIIVDENDVGTRIDKAANLKSIVTHDVFTINRKHRMPVKHQFFGFMVQCLNEFPRAMDKTNSFYRRQLFVPFTKTFTGAEKMYIRDDYLQRREVLEYVFWYAINRAGTSSPGNYYQLSEPAGTKVTLAEYKETNDPVRDFWGEVREQLVWDLVPFTFLYDLYKEWLADVYPMGIPVAHRAFVGELVAIVRSDALWHCPDKNRKIRPASLMNKPEVLIAEYELKKWMHPSYTGSDPKKKSQPVLKANYRGLLRQAGASAPADDTTDGQD
ncbi:phage/plasmid primase, P4 family [Streptomyces sp. NPDC057654]|uniref:DNA primase family protein n=1 Tax=Streptomyces sp. NPDC057654 TaxID=3346196 RepID=UPI003697D0EF